MLTHDLSFAPIPPVLKAIRFTQVHSSGHQTEISQIPEESSLVPSKCSKGFLFPPFTEHKPVKNH